MQGQYFYQYWPSGAAFLAAGCNSSLFFKVAMIAPCGAPPSAIWALVPGCRSWSLCSNQSEGVAKIILRVHVPVKRPQASGFRGWPDQLSHGADWQCCAACATILRFRLTLAVAGRPMVGEYVGDNDMFPSYASSADPASPASSVLSTMSSTYI